MIRHFRRWTWMGAFGLVLIAVQLLAFQNCGSDFVIKDGLSYASGSGCISSLEAEFDSSYYSFLKTNCASCHTGSGPGQGAFASSDSGVAFNAFLLATDNGTDTVTKLDTNALSTTHASGYTGSQNSSAIAVASQSWAAAAGVCKSTGGGSVTQTFITASKLMSATGTDHDITFALPADLVSGSPGDLGGASLIVAVHLSTSANGAPVYYFSNPRLKAGTRAVSVAGLMIRINGAEQTLGSTWSRVSGTATAGQTLSLSAATLLLEYDTATAADTLALTIDALSAQ